MSKGMRTEDEVRDSAKLVLGFDKTEDGVQQGTGQITTFNQLGFRGCNDKPDGWYLPDDASKPAIILETKSEAEGVSKEKHVKELFKNIDVVAKKYSKTIGILYSGSAIRVFRDKIELSDASKRLENKDYYIRLCTSQKLDSNYIFEITQKINNSLHFKFGMTDLQDRMIFTACALVAQRYNPQNGLQKLKDMDYSTFHNWIYSALSKALEDDKKQNNKLDVLLEEYASVRMSITENQEAINDFIDNVCQIADHCMQFIGCAIERITTDKYAFSEMCTGTKLLKDVILLPKDKTGQPDWAYMEEYMRKVERKTDGVLNQFVLA